MRTDTRRKNGWYKDREKTLNILSKSNRRAMLGRKHSEEAKQLMSDAHKGEKNHNWSGTNVSYNSLHHWIRNNYGSPSNCEACPKKGLSNRQIHWANMSGLYKRDRNDWRRLCVSCHKLFDLNKIEL